VLYRGREIKYCHGTDTQSLEYKAASQIGKYGQEKSHSEGIQEPCHAVEVRHMTVRQEVLECE
jgi:hypothetical protein